MVKQFAAKNNEVSFGDVNLSESSIRGPPHNPGAGGWPTIRYFNKETGIEGGNYKKKTDKSMCVELGDMEGMTAYVEEYGGVSSCSIADDSGCSDKEKAFISQTKEKTEDEVFEQLQRLLSMKGESMAPELSQWVTQRIKILEQLVPVKDEL